MKKNGTTKIAMIGFFALNGKYNGGQENKTRALAELLQKNYGKDAILKIDTLNWKKHPVKLFYSILKAAKSSDVIIMLPAQNGVMVFSRLLLLFKPKKAKLFYSVIGGWLPSITSRKKRLATCLKKFDNIWVETNCMKDVLISQGFTNVTVIPNFKKIVPIKEEECRINDWEPLRLCTFSRVLKEKGIEDAIRCVKSINEKYGRIVYSLDIFGQVDEGYQESFNKIIETMPSYIRYCGIIPYNESVYVLKDYFSLLFPTHYYTEGVPGTIIDAYAAGLPVIAAKWQSFDDVVIDRYTGIGYEFDDYNSFEETLDEIANNPHIIISLKINCVKEFEKYTEKYVNSKISSIINS